MRVINITIIFTTFVIASICHAQSDTIYIETKNGNTLAYPISMINKIEFSGTPTNVNEQEMIQNVLSTFTLRQNYPNPFNPITTIQYEIPFTGEVNVVIYDIQGREIKTLTHTTQAAGEHTLVWDARNNRGIGVSSGTYFCRIEFNNSILIKKIVYIK